MVKKLVKYIFELKAIFIGKTLSFLPENVVDYFMSTFLKKLSKYTNFYFTYHKRPKDWKNVYYSNIFKEQEYSHIGIVIQGPIVSEDNFTLNTVLLYKKLFPLINIVVSTWIDTNKKDINLFRENQIEILLLEKPKVSGSHNINFQIVSTIEGIKYFENKNIEFICKTRSDQRIYSENSFRYLEQLIHQYPVENAIAKGRIIEPSISICKYRPWSMTDMFQFGYLEDLKRMWDIDLDDRTTKASDYFSKKYRVYDIVHDNIAEIYIHREYSKNCLISKSINYEKYYKAIKELFIIINKDILDLYWNKYNALEYGLASNPLYNRNQLLSRFTHSEWTYFNENPDSIEYNKFKEMLYKYENND